MKKIITAVLVVIFALTAFCACGGEPEVISCYTSPYNSQYFIGGYDIYTKEVVCENSDKIERNSEHFPIHKIESVEELEDFRDNTLFKYAIRSTPYELKQYLKNYGEEFFVDKTLLLVGTDSNSESYVFYISSVKNDGKSFTVGLSHKLIAPGVEVYSTGPYGLVFIEVERKELEGIERFDAVEETEHKYYDAEGGLYQPTLALDMKSMDGCLVYYKDIAGCLIDYKETVKIEHYCVFQKTDSRLILYPNNSEHKIVFDINKNGNFVFNANKTSKELGIEIKNGTEFFEWNGAPPSTKKYTAEGVTHTEYKISSFYGYPIERYLNDADVLSCENMKEIIADRRGHLPIHAITSKAYLDEYIRVMLYDSPHIANDGGDAAEYLRGFDEAYFVQKAVLVVPIESGSGSYKHYVSGLKKENGCLTVGISKHLMQPDIAITADMSYRLTVIEVDRSVLDGVNSFDAVYDTQHVIFKADFPGYIYGLFLSLDENSKEYFFNFCVPYKNPQKSKYTSSVQTAQRVTLYGKYEENGSELVLLPSDEHGNKIVLDIVGQDCVYNAKKSELAYEIYLEDGTVFSDFDY